MQFLSSKLFDIVWTGQCDNSLFLWKSYNINQLDCLTNKNTTIKNKCQAIAETVGSIMNQHLGTNRYCFLDLSCDLVIINLLKIQPCDNESIKNTTGI